MCPVRVSEGKGREAGEDYRERGERLRVKYFRERERREKEVRISERRGEHMGKIIREQVHYKFMFSDQRGIQYHSRISQHM